MIISVTDNTVKIALDNNCKVIQYDTNNKLRIVNI